MTEQVQAILDGMVAPLRDLEERGVFSAEEIHAIVDRRRQSEYALRRRQPRKADFIEYIQTEINLEKLRELRCRRLKSQLSRSDHSRGTTKSIGDKHIRSHIHLIWTRTLRKFRSDLSLYLSYADYLEETKNFSKLSILFARALQIFPRQEGLWIRAASHEFFQAGNIQSARILLQRGLRINEEAPDLWIQAFVLELHIEQRLRGRQAILSGQDTIANNQKDDESGSQEMARIIFDHAITKNPNDVAFRVRFLEQCELFPQTNSLAGHIVRSLERDCNNRAEAWIAQALFTLQHLDDIDCANSASKKQRKKKKLETTAATYNPVMGILQKATHDLPTTEMYCQALRFVKKYMLTENSKRFADDLYRKASADGLLTIELVLEYIDLLNDDKSHASSLIEDFVADASNKIAASAYLRLASLVDVDKAVSILERGARMTPITEVDHFVLLLQLMGARLRLNVEAKDLLHDQRRIIYLSAGFIDAEDVSDPLFGVRNVLDACLQCLHHVKIHHGLSVARKVYAGIVFQSGILQEYMKKDPNGVKSYMDAALAVEHACQDKSDRERHLVSLHKVAGSLFAGTSIAKYYREKLQESMHDSHINLPGVEDFLSGSLVVPSMNLLSSDFSPETVERVFEVFQVVHLRSACNRIKTVETEITWKDFASIFEHLNEKDQETWCVETAGDSDKNLSPKRFLQSVDSTKTRAYCSFLIQNDKQALQDILTRLPMQTLELSSDIRYENALWVFFGRNPRANRSDTGDLDGRPEHTDSVSHDGTWHYQLSGKKVWTIRPSPEMKKHFNQHFTSDLDVEHCVKVCVEEGDVLVINTRLWFHQTTIPQQECPSVSYARDFYFDKGSAMLPPSDARMMNLDGLYATEDIDSDTIIFRESEMPSCSLHRASADTSNCRVVDLEDGTSAVVSIRAIKAGEFFCVPETDDESDSSDSKSIVSEGSLIE